MKKNLQIKPAALAAYAALAIGVLAAGLAATRSDAADDKKPAAKPALTVSTVQPQQVRLPVKLPANGNITAWQEAIVGAEANGLRLIEVRVNVGDTVRRGQVLATFAPETIRADVAQAKAALSEAEANAADAAANAGRARSLQQTGALSAAQINQYLTAEQTARAKVEAARAAYAAQQVRFTQTQVLAPDNGIISARAATVGAVVGAGTELFRLIRGGRLEWRAEVTSAELGRITAGTTAQVTAASGARLEGRVRMIAPTVDPQTRSGLVYVDVKPLPGQAGGAKAGMFARGEFDLGATPALTVPQSAVVVRDGFSYVYRLGEGDRVAQAKVTTGRVVGNKVEITSGLDVNARVVASGGSFLNDGDLVRVAAAAPGTPASAPAPAASK